MIIQRRCSICLRILILIGCIAVESWQQKKPCVVCVRPYTR